MQTTQTAQPENPKTDRPSYSIVEARNNFAALVRDAENSDTPVQVTRHGKPVVVILSMEEYERLKNPQPKRDWLTEHLAWRAEWGVDDMDFDPDEIWGDVRDKSPGREDNPWL